MCLPVWLLLNTFLTLVFPIPLSADLQPGATYFYKVAGEKTSEVFEFKVRVE